VRGWSEDQKGKRRGGEKHRALNVQMGKKDVPARKKIPDFKRLNEWRGSRRLREESNNLTKGGGRPGKGC